MIPSFSESDSGSSELAKYYIENGFVLVEGLITQQERTEIRGELVKINRGELPNESVLPLEEPESDETSLTSYMYIGEPHVSSPAISSYIRHPGMTAVLGTIVGAHIPYWDGAYKCVQTMAVSKKPGGNGSPWHQDEHPIPTRDRSLTGIWIPLEDTTVENGCLWIIPNSHRSGVIYDRFAHDLPDVDSMSVARGFDDATQIPIEMKAGSVLFFNGYLLHSSKKNVSTSHRPALTMHYCTASSLFAWKEQRNYRGVISVEGADPYAEEGYTTPQTWAVRE